MTPQPRRLRRLAELVALTAFAITQPVLDITGRSPDFFLYRQSTPGEMRLLLVLVALGPALLLMWAELAIAAVDEVAARVAHLAFVAVLFAAIAVQVGKQAGLFTGWPLGLLALAAGAGLAVAYARLPTLRQMVVYAAPAPMVFVLLFALTTPSGALVRPAREGRDAAVAANRPPVVFLLLDEFPVRSLLRPNGAVEERLFPNFARLAGMSTWYQNATGVSGWTPWAVPAMLSGVHPAERAAPHYGEFPDNLFTLLSRSYDVKAFESIANLCPPDICSGVPAGRPTGLLPLLKDTAGVAREVVSPYPPPVREGGEFAELGQPNADDPKFRFDQAKLFQPTRLTSFLDTLKPTGRPTLSFLHLLLPHGPHQLLPSGKQYEIGPMHHVIPRASDPRRMPDDPNLAILAKQRMLLQLAYTDQLIGQLLDTMESTGILDDALLVVTADHGVGFGPGGYWRWLDAQNVADAAYVPFFLKLPGQTQAKTDLRNEQHVDLLPTVADVLDVEVPWRVDGQSALGPPRGTDDKVWYDEPGRPVTIDGARWLPQARTGFAHEVAKPSQGVRGLFAVAGVRPYYGRKVAELDVGAPAEGTLTLEVDMSDVDPAAAYVPGMLWGTFDRAMGPSSRWLAVAVNGTIAGGVLALPGLHDGKWRFFGLVDDAYLVAGRNDVTFYTVEGSVLHPIEAAS